MYRWILIFLILPAIGWGQIVEPSTGGGTSDSIGVDTDGDGSIDNYLYPATLKKGTNMTFTVNGDILTIAGPAASGTADSMGIDSDGDGTVDNYLYSNVAGAFHLKKGANITMVVAGDTVTIAAVNVAVSDSTAGDVDTTGTDISTALASRMFNVGDTVTGTYDFTQGNLEDINRIYADTTTLGGTYSLFWDTDHFGFNNRLDILGGYNFNIYGGRFSDSTAITLGGGMAARLKRGTDASNQLFFGFDGETANQFFWGLEPDSHSVLFGVSNLNVMRLDSLGNLYRHVLTADSVYELGITLRGVMDDSADAAVTFENLNANGDVGTGADQVAQGDHNHDATYETITNVGKIGDDTTNFKTAYGWGDHGVQNYLDDDTADDVDDLDIDWGTGANQVSIIDIPATAWRVIYSNGSGVITELALGGDGTYLKSNGASAAPTWATPTGAGTSDSMGVDTDGDGSVDNYLYSTVAGAFHIKKGANITLTVVEDTVTIAGDAGSGTADSLGIDTDGDGSVDNYLYSTTSMFAMIREGTGIALTVDEDTVYIAATLGTAVDGSELDTGLQDSITAAYDSSQVLDGIRTEYGKIGDDTSSFHAAYDSLFNWFGVPLEETDTHILVANGTVFNNVLMSGDASIDNTGVITVADNSHAHDSTSITNAGVGNEDLPDSVITVGKIDHSDTETNWLDAAYFRLADYDNSTIDTSAGGALQVKDDGIGATQLDETESYTWTGAHDFGGATSLELPNADAPTTTVEGQIAWDANDNALEFFNSEEDESVLIPTYKVLSIPILLPDSVGTYTPILFVYQVNELAYPAGIEIDSLGIQLESDAAYSMVFEEWTGADPPVETGVLSTVTTGASDTRAMEAPDTDDGVAAGSWIVLDIPATDVDVITCIIVFHVTEG